MRAGRRRPRVPVREGSAAGARFPAAHAVDRVVFPRRRAGADRPHDQGRDAHRVRVGRRRAAALRAGAARDLRPGGRRDRRQLRDAALARHRDGDPGGGRRGSRLQHRPRLDPHAHVPARHRLGRRDALDLHPRAPRRGRRPRDRGQRLPRGRALLGHDRGPRAGRHARRRRRHQGGPARRRRHLRRDRGGCAAAAGAPAGGRRGHGGRRRGPRGVPRDPGRPGAGRRLRGHRGRHPVRGHGQRGRGVLRASTPSRSAPGATACSPRPGSWAWSPGLR